MKPGLNGGGIAVATKSMAAVRSVRGHFDELNDPLVGFTIYTRWHYLTVVFIHLHGGVVVLPVIVVYTIGVYWVFRGKVRKGYGRTTGVGI